MDSRTRKVMLALAAAAVLAALGGIATGPFGDIPWVAVKRK